MVSGFLTSPNDHARICSGDARPMRIASKLLTSIRFKGWNSVGPAAPALTQGWPIPRRHVGAPTVAPGAGHRSALYHAASSLVIPDPRLPAYDRALGLSRPRSPPLRGA